MKYEFTGKTKTVLGVNLRQIRALVTIVGVVSAGDVGGWIESEKNLSRVSGNAWVYGDALVYGDARVFGDALVSGNAQVYGDARVSGNAQVYGNALVYGNAHVSGNAHVYGDALVSGNAQVYGDARVSGNAQVYGDAWVFGDARVSGNALVYGNGLIFWASKVGTENGTITVSNSKDNSLIVTRGCFIGTTEQFLSASNKKHDARTQHEYGLLIEVATSRIEAARAITAQEEEVCE